MESLLKVQVENKKIIDKARINFKKSPKERLTQVYVETRLESLEDRWQDFVKIHKEIIELADDNDLKGSYFTKDIYDQTEELYLTYKTELKEYVRGSTHVGSESKQFTIGNNVKLPKISLPRFSGNYSEWTTFRDLFVSLIAKNDALDEVQKLHYLKGHLSGEAEQLLRHTPVTASNYTECWSILIKRYDNKRFLSNCMLKRLFNQPPISKESSTAIKNLLDTTVDCLHGLSTLNINVSSWDAIVVFIISAKLDFESRKLWESQISSGDELATFDEFKEFLESRFRSLEYLDVKSVKPNVIRNNAKSFHIASQICILCSGDHKLCHCKEFAKKDTDSRREFARVNKICFNCLAKNHNVFSCRQATRCHLCKKRHHTLLHPKPINAAATGNTAPDTNTVVAAAAASPNQCERSPSVCCYADVRSHGLLATALVNVESKTGSAIVLRALMDQGSQVSFITESAVQLLGLRKTSAHTDIIRLGDDEGVAMPSRWIVSFKIQSRLDPTFVVPVSAYVLKRLTSHLPERKMVQVSPSSFASLELADPSFDTPGKIDLLLSTRVVGEVLQEGLVKGPPGTPIAQKTKLGWILSGEVSQSMMSPVCCSVVTRPDVNELLRKFWELESDESPSRHIILTEEEQKCEDLYSSSTKRDAAGRYIVRLPFKSDNPQCPYGRSEEIARKRFHMLERRLFKNPELGMQYKSVIQEYLQLGHAEVVPRSEIEETAVYLPHHAVVREDKSTTKVRVVFDASCSGCNGVSLNDDLMVGPTLQPDLRHTIMRWRCHPICLIADIVKMYRQVKVSDEQVNYQRILWRENPDDDLRHLRLLRVTFGTSSAPYLAIRTLQQLAYDEGKDFPLVSKRILKDFYVDDFLSGCESVAEGVQVYREINELLDRGGFQLQKWSSNSDELLNKILPSGLNCDEFLKFGTESSMKILGLTWNRNSDKFQYTVHLPPLETPVTKRRMISDIARLFDPLGWIAPVIITAKVFIQRVWLSGIEWDDELPDHLLKDWLDYRSNLHNLQNFHLPRWIHTSCQDKSLELQGFCDASMSAYSAVVYTRSIDSDGHVHVSLVASKTKVAPIKQVSIPRLELCGAVLLSKLLTEVSDTLGIAKDNVRAWTDSSVVLSWLSSHPSRWKTFIGNRVAEILRVMNNNQWSHVQSRDNPADCASRGVNPCDLENLHLWVYGPSWLKNEEINYSKGILIDTNLEERKLNVVVNAVTEQEEKEDFISRFSTLRKLTRITAYCRRFLKLKNKSEFTVNLTSVEINEALLTCVRKCQADCFGQEINILKKTGKIDKKGKITSLCPYLDQDNILRVGGRLHRANIPQDMKHPIIVPHKSHLTTLLIADAHERTLHGGPQLVLNYLRSSYWIINAKSVVRQYIHRCVTCVRYSARTNQPLMGQLPASRVNAGRPFRQSGVDYAGPINIRPTKGRGYHSTKGYICLFICMATRAIHLEVVSDMTSQAFISAFKRFTARRGHCDNLWSDNGTTFVGANKELQNLFHSERLGVAPDIADWLATNGTSWHFIPPHSPNFGGLWEAGIKSTKHHLKRIIGTSTLTFEEMITVLAQIEACLNSRPLSTISCNPEDPCPLTPGHFLIGEALLLVPECNFETSNISTLKRWHLTQRMVQDFWRRWSREYLVQFHQRYKWSRNSSEPNVGDVVLVMEDDLPPSRWLHGLIVEKHSGSDHITRVVSLRCKGSIIKRPVSKLIVLPIAN